MGSFCGRCENSHCTPAAPDNVVAIGAAIAVIRRPRSKGCRVAKGRGRLNWVWVRQRTLGRRGLREGWILILRVATFANSPRAQRPSATRRLRVLFIGAVSNIPTGRLCGGSQRQRGGFAAARSFSSSRLLTASGVNGNESAAATDTRRQRAHRDRLDNYCVGVAAHRHRSDVRLTVCVVDTVNTREGNDRLLGTTARPRPPTVL